MRRLVSVVIFFLLAVIIDTAPARADVLPLDRPDTQGDQLIFYYDARAGFTSFLTVRNVGSGGVTVSIVFYGPTFSTPFTQTATIPGRGLKIFDAGGLRDSGLPAQQGIAFATVVDGGHPVVSDALTGSFTVANIATGSAWGSPALARSARNASDSSFPMFGTAIDNSTVVLQAIRPLGLELAGFYKPESLAPVENGGNQVIFVTFEDVPGETFAATVGSTTWNVFATQSNGTTVADTMFTANGVTVTDLATLLGSDVNGAPGGVRFTSLASPPALSRLIFFAEALGTFGTGYLLPTVPVLL
jgi:hypothetical protein